MPGLLHLRFLANIDASRYKGAISKRYTELTIISDTSNGGPIKSKTTKSGINSMQKISYGVNSMWL